MMSEPRRSSPVDLTPDLLARIEHAVRVGATAPVRTVLEALPIAERDRTPAALLLLGRCRWDAGDVGGALAACRDAERHGETRLRALAMSARIHAAARDERSAELALRALGESGADRSLLDPARIWTALSLGRWDRLAEGAAPTMLAGRTLAPTADEAETARLFARNLLALRHGHADRAERLAARRPWDRLSLVAAPEGWTAWRRTGGDPVLLFEPAEQHAREAHALAACEPALTVVEPVLLLGPGTGQVVHELARVEPRHGKRLPILLVSPDDDHLAMLLLVHDWSDLLRTGVLRILGGEPVELECWLRADLRRAPRSLRWNACFVGEPAFTRSYAARARAILDSLWKEARTEVDGLTPRYGSSEFAATFTLRAAGGGLSVLFLASRYTTFVHANTGHLALAMSAAGHRSVLMEEGADPHAWLGPLAVAGAVAADPPDLIVRINFLRQEESGFLPEGLPFLTWVQDYCPTHFAAGAVDGLVPRDYLAGVNKRMAADVGYPLEHYFAAAVPSLASVYRAAARGKRDYRHEIAYVSHQSQTAEAWLERFAASGRPPDAARWTRQLFNLIEALCGNEDDLSAVWTDLVGRLGELAPDRPVEPWMSEAALQLGNLVYRHRVLGWIGASGRDLALYGNGWERHPSLGKHARGAVANGAALRDLYTQARIHLQLMITGNFHQRLIDGLLAGGFFLMPTHRMTPSAMDLLPPGVRDDVVQTLAHEPILSFRELRRFWPPLAERMIAALGPGMADVGRPGLEESFLSVQADLTGRIEVLLPRLGEVQFRGRSELLSLMDRWLADDDAREAFAQSIASSPMLESLTAESLTRRVLAWLGRRIGCDPPVLLPAWLADAYEDCEKSIELDSAGGGRLSIRGDAGTLRASGIVRGGRLDGEWQFFDSLGRRMRTCGFSRGRLSGPWVDGHPGGGPRREAIFLDDRPVGTVRERSPSGDVLREIDFESPTSAREAASDPRDEPVLVDVLPIGVHVFSHRGWMLGFAVGVVDRGIRLDGDRAAVLYRTGRFFLAREREALLAWAREPLPWDPLTLAILQRDWASYRGH